MTENELEHTLKPLLVWLDKHFNIHRFLWLLSVVCLFIAWNRGIALLYGMLALLLAVILISWVLPWFSVRNISVERSTRGLSEVGGTVHINYKLSMKRPCFHLIVREKCDAFENNSIEYFLPSVENGSKFSVDASCDKRGVFYMDHTIIGCAWPFGFVHVERKQSENLTELIVIPRVFEIKSFPSLGADLNALDGSPHTARYFSEDEFAGVRDFRHGDSLKHIHWAASARHNDLIVREYESLHRTELLVVLDLRASENVGEGKISTFEYMLSVAASLIHFSLEREWGIKLYAHSKQPWLHHVLPGNRNSNELIEPLAWLNTDGDEDYNTVIQQALQLQGDSVTLVTFRNSSNDGGVQNLAGSYLDIVFEDQSFIYPLRKYNEGWQRHGSGKLSLHINSRSDLKNLFNESV